MTRLHHCLALSAVALCGGALTGGQALAWGAMGHRLIGALAVEGLPPELPAFLRTAQAAQQVGELAREPDRSKGSGQPHDHDLDPGHFVNVDDTGRVRGGPPLSDLPPDREQYDAALRAAGTDAFKSGYLPYNIDDGFQQLAKDFAYWRVETAALRTATDAGQRAWIARDRALREQLALRDLGVWAHFIGDGSQPLHVSVHYNGWGPYPNPQRYTDDRLHGPFEGAFIHTYVTAAMVRAQMTPYRPCAGPLAACTATYLAATGRWVEPLYALWGQGGFVHGDARGRAFAAARLADGASALRDRIVDAWRASADGEAGYQPSITVKAAEAGQPVPIAALYGSD